MVVQVYPRIQGQNTSGSKAKQISKVVFFGTPLFKHESSEDFKGTHFSKNPHPKPVNIFRSKAVPKKRRNKNSSLSSITNGVAKIISKVQGEKKSISFLPPKLSLL